ncbi:hypothetical protein [Rhizobium phage RHph_X2_28B]|uniref:hypothetical protein n=1 Tax=Rhizobium phage RHph_X2_28B TaxID=2836086 RepID=UPI0023292BD2|nr:hypothetical protein PP751_gp085 [Rhizobium phage RHph_X2_28B]QWY83537.1 hypothetical protein [Rhizobium phage RHph_X2_28B]
MTAKTPDELMADYCYTPSSTIDSTSGVQFQIELTPQEEMEFGNWATTKTSTYKEFTVTNTGYDDVVITRFEVAGDFLFLDEFPSKIEAGASYTGRLHFSPTVVGTRKGLVSIDAENAIGDKSLSLSGVGWDFTDLDIKGIVNEAGITLDDFPYWEDQLDMLVNTDLPIALV